ncbi:unnamed protein product, partial [Ceratitis capitata]
IQELHRLGIVVNGPHRVPQSYFLNSARHGIKAETLRIKVLMSILVDLCTFKAQEFTPSKVFLS